MDHNNFDFDEDFIEPVFEFFKQIGLKTDEVEESTVEGLQFSDDYYFPPNTIVGYEKKLIKTSIIWDIIEERNRQEEARKIKEKN